MKRGKNSLSAFAINLINIDDNQIFRGKWKVNIVKNFCKLKREKENGNVLIKAIDYDISVQISQTPTRLATLKCHLKQLNKRGK